MRFSLIVLISLLASCTFNYTKLDNRKPYNSKGFAYIYNQEDLKNNLIRGKMNNPQIDESLLRAMAQAPCFAQEDTRTGTVRTFGAVVSSGFSLAKRPKEREPKEPHYPTSSGESFLCPAVRREALDPEGSPALGRSR